MVYLDYDPNDDVDYLPSVKHGQFTATPAHERSHDLHCPCLTEIDDNDPGQDDGLETHPGINSP